MVFHETTFAKVWVFDNNGDERISFALCQQMGNGHSFSIKYIEYMDTKLLNDSSANITVLQICYI